MPGTIKKGNLYQENRIHSSALVPFSYYESRIPDYFPHVPLHWHKEFEINYILSGHSKFIVGDNQFIADEGDIILIQPNVLHAVYQYENTSQIYDTIVFRMDMVRSANADRSMREYIEPLTNGFLYTAVRISNTHNRYAELNLCMQDIILYAKKNSAQYDLFVKCALFRLFAILADAGELHSDSRHQPTQSVINIAETAYTCGFSNLSNFNRQFRSQMGMSPTEYMKQ